MNDVLVRAGALWKRLETAAHDMFAQLRLPTRAASGPGAHRALQPLDRRAHGHRQKRNVHVRGSRRKPDAASRSDGRSRSRRLSNGLLHNQQQKLWCCGPMFRREKPQKGRYRQFHQISVEALGFADPEIDAELIAICARLWRELGIAICNSRSILWARPNRASATKRHSSRTSRSTASCSTRTACADWSAIRCAFSIARTRRCAR